MNHSFYIYLSIGIGLVLAQFIAAYLDGFATRVQLKSQKIVGYSFLENGSMLSDIVIVSPVVADILSTYRFDYFGRVSIYIAIVDVMAVAMLINVYRKWGEKMPEAHAHYGEITVAGWIHAVYAVVGIWTVAMFYFAPAKPVVTCADMFVTTLWFMPWCILGPVKFSPYWKPKTADVIAIAGMIAAFLLVFAIKAPYAH